jgi:hypothetical protein
MASIVGGEQNNNGIDAEGIVNKLQVGGKGKHDYVWHYTGHLKYDYKAKDDSDNVANTLGNRFLCHQCLSATGKLLKCPKCGIGFCSQTCFKQAWKKHKKKCPAFLAVRKDRFSEESMTFYKESIVVYFQSLRIYWCPYAVNRSQVLGSDGFLLVQAKTPIDEFIHDVPVSFDGKPLNRSFVVEYLPINEFTERLKTNFELGVVLDDLIAAVNNCDKKKYMVVLVMAPCGFMTVVSVPLVPDYGICAKLGVEHRELPIMVFNIDSTD